MSCLQHYESRGESLEKKLLNDLSRKDFKHLPFGNLRTPVCHYLVFNTKIIDSRIVNIKKDPKKSSPNHALMDIPGRFFIDIFYSSDLVEDDDVIKDLKVKDLGQKLSVGVLLFVL